MAELQTVDEIFSDAALAPSPLHGISPYPAAVDAAAKPQALQTTDEIFGPSEPSFVHRADSAIQSSIFRIFNAFGYSGAKAFGEEPIATPSTALDKGTEEFLKRNGAFNDYSKGQQDFSRAMFEGVFKGAAAGLALTQRGLAAAVAAPLGALGQAGEELGLAAPGKLTGEEGLPGAATDPGAMMALGPFGEYTALTARANATRAANLHVDLSVARAHGVLGEGEAGFYDAKPLTPENAQARVDAANDAGMPPPMPEPVPVDVHELARRIDPPAFEKYDALQAEKDAQRQTIQDLAVDRENLPEAVQAKDEINTILSKVHGVEDRLTKAAAGRLADAQDRLDRILSKDTPEMATARKSLLQADIAQRDLAPGVSAAYRQAHDLMPEPVNTTAEAMQAASEGKPVEVAPAQPETPPAESPAQPATVGQDVSAPPTLRVIEGGAQAPTGPGRTTTNIRSVAGTGEAQTRTLSEGVEAKAIESGLTERFGDLPEYRQLSMADQAAQAAEFIRTSPDDAKAVALGQKQPPKGVLPESIFVAVEKKAIMEGDVETLRQLATESKLTTAATTMGQRIRTLKERDPTSPVGAIQEVQRARAADLEKRNATAQADTVKEIKTAIRKSASSRDAWAEFLTSITCPD